MLRYHMAVITRENALKRAIKNMKKLKSYHTSANSCRHSKSTMPV